MDHVADVDEDLLQAAGHLAQQAGKTSVLALEPLAGGKNNRVFRAVLADGGVAVLKSYFVDPRDPRNRLAAEWAFIDYAWARGVRNLPRPLARDSERNIALYAYVPGRRLAPAEVDASHVAAALDFVVAVNRHPRDMTLLTPGSEACFTLSQHIETVERRVRRLATLDPEVPLRAQAEALVAGRLIPAWRKVRARIETAARGTLGQMLTPSEVLASPSDFGFHNALLDETSGQLTFIDFEYAGQDDPAKLICDFFCQPEVPVPVTFFGDAVDRLVTDLGLPEMHRERCPMLLDLYRLKWVCIILNQFLPVGAARRAFAQPADALAQGANQLAKADVKLSHIGA